MKMAMKIRWHCNLMRKNSRDFLSKIFFLHIECDESPKYNCDLQSFYPFSSREELLLYILVNSPTPIVSITCNAK